MRPAAAVLAAALLSATAACAQGVRVEMAERPALSADGRRLAFSWRDDLWVVDSGGGTARRLTTHPGDDGEPCWSPDGTEIAFTSDRSGTKQVHVIPAEGGEPIRLTVRTTGWSLMDWSPDGSWLLARTTTDTGWPDNRRLFRVPRLGGRAELLFDAYGGEARIAPDGRRIVFVREGTQWWRQGYRGSEAGQVWTWSPDDGFRSLVALPTESRWPLWRPDGRAVYYAGAEGGRFAIREVPVGEAPAQSRPVVTPAAAGADVYPCLSRDGRTLVFRRDFDLYRVDPAAGGEPRRIEITVRADDARPPVERATLDKVSTASFSADGLEVAFVAGGDIWVMDTILREPRQVTATAEEERGVVFAPDGSALYCVSERGGQPDLWRVERADTSLYWWRNERFLHTALTADAGADGRPIPSPDGKRIAWIRGLGDLWTATTAGKDAKRLLSSWNPPEYAWSPDSRWIAYAVEDTDFNSDIWIVPADGSAPAVNVSRHPYSESNPVWSPDGRVLAFRGDRREGETDLFTVWLRREDDEREKRDRTLDEAVRRMKEVRKDGEPPKKKPDGAGAVEPVRIDFEGLHERVRRIPVDGKGERGLFWKPDSTRLGFAAAVKGQQGTWAIDFPESGEPKLIVAKVIDRAQWLAEGDQIVGVADGVPGTFSKGAWKAFPFSARQTIQVAARQRAAFVQAWRLMRDTYYDGRLNNRDWDAIRAKYEDAAARAADAGAFSAIVNLMLGELNGSHLGFFASGRRWNPADGWAEETPWLGIRWASRDEERGLRVAAVVREGPADRAAVRLRAGDRVLRINGRDVGPGDDLDALLAGPPRSEIVLTVADSGLLSRRPSRTTRLREVRVRAGTWGDAGDVLYANWLRSNRENVERLSGGTAGYIHIRGMDWTSFDEFERQLYAAGAGKDGLVIDVRENGGGFTADHLLTILCQPTHAVTVPRGGGPGYPGDRRVYAAWDRPIVVLCNQNSFSNAEILAHAIQVLKRGRVVGVPTAGGVISTGGTAIMDLGMLRLPFRGWFRRDTGEDMELAGAIPDVVAWPDPADQARGIDRQLEAAVKVLAEDVATWKAAPKPELKKASERK
ncbi:MAG: PD40 domain-containing protein [Candidatus Brocadiae bacterium]|nr:PD40 domain-containing protein [Candidatus Brocadiia bacterium]